MTKPGPLDYILRPFLTDSLTEPKVYSRAELLKATGVTSRQLTYYMQMGAVARPLGNTRAAKYTVSHLHQVQRVVELLNTSQTSVAEIAEAYASRTPRTRPVKTPSTVRLKTVEKWFVHQLTDGVRIVVKEDLLATEKSLLAALLKVGKQSDRDRNKLLGETMDRLRGRLPPPRRLVPKK